MREYFTQPRNEEIMIITVDERENIYMYFYTGTKCMSETGNKSQRVLQRWTFDYGVARYMQIRRCVLKFCQILSN